MSGRQFSLVAGDTWRRHPADIARLIASLIGLAITLAWTAMYPDTVAGVSADLVALVSWIPDGVGVVATGIAQILAVVLPVVLLGALAANRQWRLTALLTAGAIGAAAGASRMQGWLDARVPSMDTDAASWLTGVAFPSAAYVAGLAAAMTILGPSLPRRWRRLGAWSLGVAVTLRLLTAVAVPLQVLVTLFIGVAVGSLALVIAGAPSRRVQLPDLLAALRRLRIDPDTVQPLDEDRFAARTLDGEPVELHVVDRDQRDAELLLRIVRAARVRGIDDDHPSWSTERAAEHEALVTLLAAGAARVHQVVGVDVTDTGGALLVAGALDASGFDELADVTDDTLRDAWRQVAGLRSRHIAHRRLHRHHLAVGTDTREVTILRLRHGVLSASDTLLAIDVAELLTSLTLQVGAPRAVSAAVEVLGPDAVASASPVLQPLALSPSTRRELKDTDGGKAVLEDLRVRVQDATDADAVELLPLHRITLGGAVSLFGTVFLAYVALAFASNWSTFVDSAKEADWTYLPWIVLMVVLGYPAGAASLMGAVTTRLPLGQTSEVMLAQSFLNRFTPANAGGMALRVRYLQLHGADLPVAAASIGITSAASGAMQVVFLIVFLTWSSQSGDLPFSFPDVSTLALIVLVLLVVAGALWFTPLRAKVLDSRAFASVSEIWAEVRHVATSPGKIVLLFGGAGVSKLLTIVAFVLSTRAFGIDLSFAVLAALYMTANTVASAAPTPGGVGAIEAALIAALTGAGVDSAIAFSAVMVFRLVTYWLPVPFAWLGLQDLRRKDIV
jgi:uncharacterized membrane protein YbhN (UPF0104 family)